MHDYSYFMEIPCRDPAANKPFTHPCLQTAVNVICLDPIIDIIYTYH